MAPSSEAPLTIGQRFQRAVRRFFTTIVVLIVLLILLTGTYGTVEAGSRGVRLRFGAVTGDVLDSGLYFKLPFVESVVPMDVKIQKEQVQASAASKDLQTVDSTVALNYHVDPRRVTDIYQDVGVEYPDRLIAPALQEAVKGTTAKFTAEELVTKREDVRDAVKAALVDKLGSRGIVVDEFNIVNFEFSQSFNEAIEAKVTAEQSALAAKNKLEQVKFEAEQSVAEAKGKAEAIQIESAALKDNPQVLQLRALETWNGVLPLMIGSGSALPFITLGDLKREQAAQTPAQP